MVALIVLSGLSCDTQGFRDLDLPKYRLTVENADMSMMFTRTIIDYGRGYIGGNPNNLESFVLKYHASYSINSAFGSINQFTSGINDSWWGQYNSGLVNIATLEDYLLKLDDPNQVNNIAMIQILKCAIFQKMTDFYGDVPYRESSQLALSAFELNKPSYDTQEFIYKDILQVLEREAANITTSSVVMSSTWTGADLAYAGNMEQWRKFAYSLMLRMAMRMSDVEPDLAKRYAELAISQGVIVVNADNYLMKCGTATSPDARNTYSSWHRTGDQERYNKLGEYYVNWLKDKKHPVRKVLFGGRLKQSVPSTQVSSSYMSRYWWDESMWDWDLDEAAGMIHGTLTNPKSSVAEYHKSFTSPNPFYYIDERPIELFTASEMLLLIAEAAAKGWNTGSYSAESAFEAGVKANMTLLSGYPGLLKTDTPSKDYPNMHITEQEMDDYIAANPLGSDYATQKRRIAEEMWIMFYTNPCEGMFNYIRMNPTWFLLPLNADFYPQFRRHAYPQNERTNNYEKLVEAMTKRGMSLEITRENEMLERNWWDVTAKK